jgi:hypothetical protein
MLHARKSAVDAAQNRSARRFFFRFSSVAVSGLLGEGHASAIKQPVGGGRAVIDRKKPDEALPMPSAGDAKKTLAKAIREFGLDPGPIDDVVVPEVVVPDDKKERVDAAFRISNAALISLWNLGSEGGGEAAKKAEAHEFINNLAPRKENKEAGSF